MTPDPGRPPNQDLRYANPEREDSASDDQVDPPRLDHRSARPYDVRLPLPPSASRKSMAKKKATTKSLEVTLWEAADKMRGDLEAAEYKHVVLGLVFLEYVTMRSRSTLMA